MDWRQGTRNVIEEHIPLSGWHERIKRFIHSEGGSILVVVGCLGVCALGLAGRAILPPWLVIIAVSFGIFGLGALLVMTIELSHGFILNYPGTPAGLRLIMGWLLAAFDWALLIAMAYWFVRSGGYWALFAIAGMVAAKYRHRFWRHWRYSEMIKLPGVTAKPIE